MYLLCVELDGSPLASHKARGILFYAHNLETIRWLHAVLQEPETVVKFHL